MAGVSLFTFLAASTPPSRRRRLEAPQPSSSSASHHRSSPRRHLLRSLPLAKYKLMATSEQQSTASTPSTQSVRSRADPTWEYCIEMTDPNGKKNWKCMYCEKQFKGGGIHRIKQHLAGKKRDATVCKKVPYDVQFKLQNNLKEIDEKKKKGPNDLKNMQAFEDNTDSSEVPPEHNTQIAAADSSQRGIKRKSNAYDSSFFAPRTTPEAQPSIKYAMAGKEAVRRANMAIARFFYDNCIPMNVANSIFYQPMIDAIASIGSGYKGPTYQALRTNVVHDMKKEVTLLVEACRSKSRYSEDQKAKEVIAILLDNKFWSDCGIVVQIVAPLIGMLRIVDADNMPSLGYVYDGMYRARKTIKNVFMNKKSLYKPYTRIVKQRWDRQLRHSVHVAAYLLNPVFYYGKANFSKKPEVMEGFLQVLGKIVTHNKTRFVEESMLYRNREGSFNSDLAIKSSSKMKPDDWWKTFGYSSPNVQKLAIRLLSETTSSSSCERNWSVFERIHTKKSNRLEHKRLNDLVYIHYNLRLKNCDANKRRNCDPIDYESIENIEFWITDEDTSPFLDYDELENMIYDEQAVPIIAIEEG
ncbi:hypothetical protein G2W53_036991 [Senna tora]|uniref:BED-type domain-containing protein n=1 Tax=Senna tora TaxID=362788 RepID=A0A834STJ7_9FABA|nr:hypothetical protein G2W53_036991 [Senna tora]